MNDASYHLQCTVCDSVWSESETCTVCKKCNNALEVIMNLDLIKTNLNRFALEHTPLSAAKYLDFYPIRDRRKTVTLSEGNTPLYKTNSIGKKLGLPNLYVKNEGANPTGVFKDRGSLVEITKAVELGAKAVCVASTGNMAASVAAYSSSAGIPCYIFVPEGTPIGKLSQTLSYGGKLLQVRGSYVDCVKLSEEMAQKNNFYLAGDYAFREQGAKSTAFEIIEQLHWQVPDVVLVPVGCGTNLSGIWKGFWEFYQIGLVEKLPRIIAVQPSGCDTICNAFAQKQDRATIVDRPKTIASAVGIGAPLDDVKCLRALKESKGGSCTIDDDAILRAQQELSQLEAIFTEPSGAIPIAVLPKLIADGTIAPIETVVCVATGTGLKDPKAAIAGFSEAPSLDADIEAIEHYLKTGVPSVKSQESGMSNTALLTELPSKPDLQHLIETEYNYHTDEKVLESVSQEAEILLRRGKRISRADLLSILEESIENTSIPTSPLQIIDFNLTDSHNQNPEGAITVLFKETKLSATASGVGPVDALITALKTAITGKTDFWPKLQDFTVDVVTSRENALVKVRMELCDVNENCIAAKASSPDIIMASVNAFVKGYNLLYKKHHEK
jgi:threonine synthase